MLNQEGLKIDWLDGDRPPPYAKPSRATTFKRYRPNGKVMLYSLLRVPQMVGELEWRYVALYTPGKGWRRAIKY